MRSAVLSKVQLLWCIGKSRARVRAGFPLSTTFGVGAASGQVVISRNSTSGIDLLILFSFYRKQPQPEKPFQCCNGNFNRLLMTVSCYWEARSHPDCIIIIINLAVTLTLIASLAYYYRRASAMLRRKIVRVYEGIAAWALVNLARNVYSLLVFLLEGLGDPARSSVEFNYQRAFIVLDILESIIIQSFFLALPFMMWINVTRLLRQRNLPRSNSEKYCLKFFVYYQVIRLVLLVLPTVAIVLVSERAATVLNNEILGFQLFDALVCCLAVRYSILCFRRRFDCLGLDASEQKQLVWEYYLMFGCSLVRFCSDLVFLLPAQEAQCLSPFSEHLFFSLGYLLVMTWVLHFLPIMAIIYIYRPISSYSAILET